MNKRISLIIIGALCVNMAYAHTINWKVDGITQSTTTCNAGDNVTPPTAPAKTGYTFIRWQPLYDFSTLDYNIGTSWDATHTRWKPINGSSGYLMQSEFGTENSSDLSNGEWADTFSYGTVIGNALCSTTSGTWATAGTPANDGGQYCWCMATGYQPADSDVVYSPNSPLSWVSYDTHVSASNCAYYCAVNCAYDVQNSSDVRRAVFGQTN